MLALARRAARSKSTIFTGTIFGISSGVYLFQDEPTKRKIRVTAQGFTRFIRSVTASAIVALDYKISLHDVSRDSPDYQARRKEVHQRAAERLLRVCLKNGGLYIKLGQGLVTMNHILPKEYLDTLVVLQDRVLTRGPHEVEALFLEDFGKLPSEVFKEFDKTPIAAASLAQVHKATTYDDRQVAVKVQYIDLRDRFTGDMLTMQILARTLGYMYPTLDFAWMLKELRGNLARELDFVAEAQNAEKCASDLSHLPFIYVPKIDWKLTSQRILTTEFIDGVKISDKKTLQERGISLPEVDYKLVRCFADQIFHSGHVHADPHPGNLLVRKDSSGHAEIVLLDHGLYESIGTKQRIALAKMYKAIILKDEDSMRENALELNVAEWHLFACFLTQKYVSTKSYPAPDWRKLKTRADWKKLSEKEKKELREYFRDVHDRVLDVMKDMPSALLLISRNLNTIRSINRDHGNLVDRYTIMARSAVEGAQQGEVKRSGFGAKLKTYREKMIFEYYLRMESLRTWIVVKTLTFLQWMGKVPDLEDMINKNAPKDVDYAS